MFLTYLFRELGRRPRQALAMVLGLAVGVGLVITVSSLAQGVQAAQTQVLHSLYGVGTDIRVSQTAAAGTGGGQRFGFDPADRSQQGRNFARDRVTPTRDLALFSTTKTDAIAKLANVKAAASGLTLNDIQVSGQLPDFSRGGGFNRGAATATPTQPPINVNSFTVDGVDLTHLSVGPFSSGHIGSGRGFSTADSNSTVAILSQTYATQNSVQVGSKVTIAATPFTVVGIVSPTTETGMSANVYIPLAQAQKLASQAGNANQIYVQAASASAIPAVQKEIQQSFPQATVTSAQDVASQVTGSLSSASNVASNTGKWLAAAVLIAAFLLAVLLTMSAVSRRIREFGTLKAIGWRGSRIAGQVLGEAFALGVTGGLVGALIGVAGAFAIPRLVPTLAATLPAVGGRGGGFLGRAAVAAAPTSQTVTVHLSTPISVELVALAVGLAIAGSLIAGSFGAWRAARLRPAVAMRKVE